MTNKEYKKIRGEYRPTVRAAYLEWKIYANSGFAETNRTLALYAEYWGRLTVQRVHLNVISCRPRKF